MHVEPTWSYSAPDLIWAAIESQIPERDSITNTGNSVPLTWSLGWKKKWVTTVWIPALKARRLQCISGLLEVKSSPEMFFIEMSLAKREAFECVCCAAQQHHRALSDTVGGPQFLKHCWPNKCHEWGCFCATIGTGYHRAWLAFWETRQLTSGESQGKLTNIVL